MMKNCVLFTHDDLDGAGCRILYNLALDRNEYNCDEPTSAVYNCSNNGIDEIVLSKLHDGTIGSYTKVWFADIAPSLDVVNAVKNVANKFKIRVFDHHPTNEYLNEILTGANVMHTDENGKMLCGTSILHNHLISTGFYEFNVRSTKDILELFIDTIRSYDTYEWKSTDNILAKQLMTLFTLMGMDTFCEYYYRILTSDIFDNENLLGVSSCKLIADEHMLFVNARLSQEEKIIESITPQDVSTIDVRGYKVALLTKSVFADISELAYKFLTKYPDYDIFIAASLAAGGKFEIRTIRDDIDTGKVIALPIGGGGHPKASGAPISVNVMNTFISNLINQLRGDLI